MNVNAEYRNICDGLTSLKISNTTMNSIKVRFRDEINSDRALAKITNMKYLLKILEKRDSLNENNVNALSIIASAVDAKQWIIKIDNYLRKQVEPEVASYNLPKVLPSVPSDPEERVFDLICTEIGQKWKDLARNLNIKEGSIDDFEYRYKRISDIVREILLYYKSNCDQRFYRIELCEAIEKSRRKDLALKVQRTYAEYHLM